MSSLVDYADSDEEVCTDREKRSANSISCMGQDEPSKVARIETDEVPQVARIETEELVAHEELSSISVVEESVCESVCDSLALGDATLPQVELSSESLANLHDNVRKLLTYRGRGKTINQYIGESSQFQNPYCLEMIMRAFDINPYSSNYPPLLYDPKAVELWEGCRYQNLSRLQASQPRSPLPASDATSTAPAQTSTTRLNKWDVKEQATAGPHKQQKERKTRWK